MQITIEPLQADDADECEQILRALPEWFGIEKAINDYRRDMDSEETFVAWAEGAIVGFASIKPVGDVRMSIHVLAVRPEHHRRGVGRALVAHVESILTQRGIAELEVKTLGPSHPDPGYALTRAFYAAMGFEPVRETTEIWGQANPCLILQKLL